MYKTKLRQAIEEDYLLSRAENDNSVVVFLALFRAAFGFLFTLIFGKAFLQFISLIPVEGDLIVALVTLFGVAMLFAIKVFVSGCILYNYELSSLDSLSDWMAFLDLDRGVGWEVLVLTFSHAALLVAPLLAYKGSEGLALAAGSAGASSLSNFGGLGDYYTYILLDVVLLVVCWVLLAFYRNTGFKKIC